MNLMRIQIVCDCEPKQLVINVSTDAINGTHVTG